MTKSKFSIEITCYTCGSLCWSTGRLGPDREGYMCPQGHHWIDGYWEPDCARCGLIEREHLELRSVEFGAFMVCPGKLHEVTFLKP